MTHTRAELIAAAEVDALIDRLHALADPTQTAVPAFADTDWRSLAYRCATVIDELRAQAAAAGDGDAISDECHIECQYAKDVAMPEYQCVSKCQYAGDGDGAQEPVGEVVRSADGFPAPSLAFYEGFAKLKRGDKLYLAPPAQAERIGLLREAEEALNACTTEEGPNQLELVRARQVLERIRAALKEG